MTLPHFPLSVFASLCCAITKTSYVDPIVLTETPPRSSCFTKVAGSTRGNPTCVDTLSQDCTNQRYEQGKKFTNKIKTYLDIYP